MRDWLEPHLFGVLLGIEIMWVAGFLAVFVIYFAIRLKIKKDKKMRDKSLRKDKAPRKIRANPQSCFFSGRGS